MNNQEGSAAKAIPSHPECVFADLLPRISSPFTKLSRGIDLHYTYDGRGALFQVFSALPEEQRGYILLPAFHCPTMVEPVIESGFIPRFYRIRRDLSIDVDDLLNCVDGNVAAVLAVNYFGFPANLDEIQAVCKAERIVLIEDCAHSFLSADPIRLAGGRADLAIFSFKKLVPSYVGGCIRNNSNQIAIESSLIRPPLVDSIVNMKRIIDQSIDSSDSRVLRSFRDGANTLHRMAKTESSTEVGSVDDLGQTIDAHYPFHRHLAQSNIPWYARYILRGANLGAIVAARQNNYDGLRTRLYSLSGVVPVLPGTGGSVCPWAFPMIVEDRSAIDWQLKSRGVPLFTFGESLHAALQEGDSGSEKAISDALYLSSHLLCLSIHQGIPGSALDSYVNHITGVLRSS